MDNPFFAKDPTDFDGPVLSSGGSRNLDIHRIIELKRKYGLATYEDPFVELPKRGATVEEIDSMTFKR